MRITEKFVFFYGSCFSNWYHAPFVNSNGVVFKTSEHYMMYHKAKLFGDTDAMAAILLCSHPSDAKKLGRVIRNFDQFKWDTVAKSIVYKGCKLKFTQNQVELEQLLSTRGKTLVEASPWDKIWGIGLGEDDDRILDPSNWQGTNWLGEVLTQLRDDLLAL